MASSGVTAVSRVGVFVGPSVFTDAWLEAIAVTVSEKGWLLERSEDQATEEKRATNSVRICVTWQEFRYSEFSTRIVIGGSVSAVTEALSVELTHTARQRQASQRLAELRAVMSVADMSYEASRETITVPEVGMIRRASVATPRAYSCVITDAPPFEAENWSWDMFEIGGSRVSLERDRLFIDLTGRSRFLIYGPYVGLEPGRWTATLRFTIESRRSVPLAFYWGSTPDEELLEIEILEPGVYEINITHTLSDPKAVEFRIYLQRAMFAGSMVLEGLSVKRADTAVGPEGSKDQAG